MENLFIPPVFTACITEDDTPEIRTIFERWARKAKPHVPHELRRRIDFCLKFVHRPEAVGVMVDTVAACYAHHLQQPTK